MASKQLECRVVIRRYPDGRVDLGMYDPLNGRYVPLGTHGPNKVVVDRAVQGLVDKITREGHKVTFSDSTVDPGSVRDHLEPIRR